MATVEKPVAHDQTVGHILSADGVPLQRPTTILGTDEAALVRSYFLLLMHSGLEPELVCAACFDHSRDDRAQFSITDEQIIISCHCRLRFHQGVTPEESLRRATPMVPTTDQVGGVLEIAIAQDAAECFRAYKKFLRKHHLKEALRCNVCWEFNQSDGCRARVTEDLVEVQCRCRNRRYLGSTF